MRHGGSLHPEHPGSEVFHLSIQKHLQRAFKDRRGSIPDAMEYNYIPKLQEWSHDALECVRSHSLIDICSKNAHSFSFTSFLNEDKDMNVLKISFFNF